MGIEKQAVYGKFTPKSLPLIAMECEWRNNFVCLSDLAAELKAITANAVQEIQRCHTPSASARFTKVEPLHPEENTNLHFCNGKQCGKS